MLAANGTDGNQVIIENTPTAAEINAASTYELAEMDAWLTAIENDHSHHSAQRKVLDDKPAGLTDGCFLSAPTWCTRRSPTRAPGNAGPPTRWRQTPAW